MNPQASGFIAEENDVLEVVFAATHGHPVRDEVVVATFGGCHPYWTES